MAGGAADIVSHQIGVVATMVVAVHCRYLMAVRAGLGGDGVMEGAGRIGGGAVAIVAGGGQGGANRRAVGASAQGIIACARADVAKGAIVGIMDGDNRR